jgi:hypothetical protein
MSLSGLTQEQKQYIILGAVGLVFVAVSLFFGIRFSVSSISVAREELDDLSRKIERADQSLEKRGSTVAELEETVARVKKHMGNAPPARNYYSWATEIIYSLARESRIEVDAVDEISETLLKKGSDIKLESYSLRITAHGGYESIRRFLQEIEREQPLVRFTGLDINKSKKPEVHDVQLYLQWPLNLSSISRTWDAIAQKQKALGWFPAQKEVLAVQKLQSQSLNEAVAGDPTTAASDPKATLDAKTILKSVSILTNENSDAVMEANASTNSISENSSIGLVDDLQRKKLIRLSSLNSPIQGSVNENH